VIGWFRSWLARFVALGAELAAALIVGILRAFRAPLDQKKKEDLPP
jgi:hypothetical protein